MVFRSQYPKLDWMQSLLSSFFICRLQSCLWSPTDDSVMGSMRDREYCSFSLIRMLLSLTRSSVASSSVSREIPLGNQKDHKIHLPCLASLSLLLILDLDVWNEITRRESRNPLESNEKNILSAGELSYSSESTFTWGCLRIKKDNSRCRYHFLSLFLFLEGKDILASVGFFCCLNTRVCTTGNTG